MLFMIYVVFYYYSNKNEKNHTFTHGKIIFMLIIEKHSIQISDGIVITHSISNWQFIFFSKTKTRIKISLLNILLNLNVDLRS